MFPGKHKSVSSFDQAKVQASAILSRPERINRLLNTSKQKLSKMELQEQDFKGILGTIRTFIRMLRAFRDGQYTVPWTTIVLVVAALLYFVVPLDLLPDFIPVAGYIDDFTVILAVWRKIRNDVEAFRIWESS